MYKMEIKKQTESVLANLMGLERRKPNKPLKHGQPRVLSKRYLQNIALICQRKKWSSDGFSMDMDDEMNDSDVYSASSDEKIPFERYEKESQKIFQEFRLLNSHQEVDTDYYPSCGGGYSVKPYKALNEKQCVLCGEHPCWKHCKSLHQNDSIGSTKLRCGVAKQVRKELQHSVWHNYSEKFRSISLSDEMDSVPRNHTRNSNFQRRGFNVHKDWCLNTGSSNCNSMEEANSTAEVDLNEFQEGDLSEDGLSAPQSPTNISVCSEVENITNKAIESVLDELPDMLHEIDSFRNRDCKEYDALRREVTDDFLMPFHESNNVFAPFKLESTAFTVQGSEIKLQQQPKKDSTETEETRVISYLADVLAELGDQPMEDITNLPVFDTLEKKYGKSHPSWLKSERRLLFDWINCGLSDILSPPKGIITWCKFRTKRPLLQLSPEIIKKELLDLLANQKMKARRESVEDMVKIDSNWLDLYEDMQIVAKEIEDDLIDKLVEEIISTKTMI